MEGFLFQTSLPHFLLHCIFQALCMPSVPVIETKLCVVYQVKRWRHYEGPSDALKNEISVDSGALSERANPKTPVVIDYLWP